MYSSSVVATPQQWGAFSKLLKKLHSMPESEPFREPVDWKSIGLLNYPEIIKQPMDLGTIRKNIDNKKYSTLSDAAVDVRLVWSNCKLYNDDGSDFHVLATSLSKKWEKQYAALLRELDLPADTTTKPSSKKRNDATLEQKRFFAKSLYELSKESVGQIIVTLDEKCPEALVKNRTEDEVELNVDKIENKLFLELLAYVEKQTVIDKKKMERARGRAQNAA